MDLLTKPIRHETTRGSVAIIRAKVHAQFTIIDLFNNQTW